MNIDCHTGLCIVEAICSSKLSITTSPLHAWTVDSDLNLIATGIPLQISVGEYRHITRYLQNIPNKEASIRAHEHALEDNKHSLRVIL